MDGILIVDKPKGCTSHDIVDFIRKKFGFKKVGHAGTLDPMATGVLVILIGKYTKSSGSFLGADKEYDATLTLGATSDTLDAYGNITPSKPIPGPVPGIGTIEEVFGRFTGPIEQMPPAYSAVKFKGKKLYELARKGIIVKVEPRKVVIKKLEISKIDMPEVSFTVTCSKGTYIRQLSADIGSALGLGAYLSRLRRTRSGRFKIEEAIAVEQLKGLSPDELKARLRYDE
ncbi:MAG: tRNA pseudouridine(55) synthase TruB [Candidatus Omnitrophota bacterium]|nr:tRNA pseudouridine(55) synthase TruB [Candidatus Omnitrophota bacterium]